jgi:hypothetical protein
LQVRLMGGLAFHALVPAWRAPVAREGRDIDLATRRSDRGGLTDLMVGEGYMADRRYNAVHGHKQLYFVDQERGRPVDVIIERFEMCHAFEFGRDLGRSYPTLPPAELLLSKLQIARINRKDILDVLILVSELPLTADDLGIDAARITSVTSSDWGWWRTVTENLDTIRSFARDRLTQDELDLGRPPTFEPVAQLNAMRSRIDEAPKSLRWTTRSYVGDRKSWYHDPEEVGH